MIIRNYNFQCVLVPEAASSAINKPPIIPQAKPRICKKLGTFLRITISKNKHHSV